MKLLYLQAIACSILVLVGSSALGDEVDALIVETGKSSTILADEAAAFIKDLKKSGKKVGEFNPLSADADNIIKKSMGSIMLPHQGAGSCGGKPASGKPDPEKSGQGEPSSGKCVSTLLKPLSGKSADRVLNSGASQALKGSQLLVFVSSSMPQVCLKALWRQAHQVEGKLVFRGLIGGTFKETQVYIQQLGIVADIDPTKFEEFDIIQVPTFVLVPAQQVFQKPNYNPKTLPRQAKNDRMVGNMSVKACLGQFAESGDFKKEASALSTKGWKEKKMHPFKSYFGVMSVIKISSCKAPSCKAPWWTNSLLKTSLSKVFSFKTAFFLTFPLSCAYGMSGSYNEGVSLAQKFPLPKPSDPNIVPGYAGANVSVSNMEAKNIGEASLNTAKKDESSQLLTEVFEKREKFVIDPLKDPLIMTGNKVIADPQKALDDEIVEIEGGIGEKDEFFTCEEVGDEYLVEGEELRIVTVAEPANHQSSIQAYSHGWGGGLSRNVLTGQKYDSSTTNTTGYAASTYLSNPLPGSLLKRVKSVKFGSGFSCPYGVSLSSSGVINIATGGGGGWRFVSFTAPIEISLLPGEEDISEHIQDNCQTLEEKVGKGLCSYEDIIVVEGPDTRVINNYPVKRDWWRRKKVYKCHHPSKNNCEPLRSKGCYQVSSSCKEKIGDACVLWEQTYQCPSLKKGGKTYRSSNKNNPFCLSGDCTDTSYQANSDFANVMSQLSVLKEAQKDLREGMSIFKGQDWRCTRNCLSFRDCCGNGKGWGVSLKLSSCDEKEKTLADLRKKNRCIEVGTYCAEKAPITKTCLRKKTTFCCYGTKLAKIVQDQGKRQLGMGFGSPKQPQCHGLTTEQLSKLNFSKINFSELFSDIAASTKVPNIQRLAQDIQESMKNKGTLLEGSLLKIQEKEGKQVPSLSKETQLSNTIEIHPTTQGRPYDQF